MIQVTTKKNTAKTEPLSLFYEIGWAFRTHVHLIDHLVNLHDQHHDLSKITSISIINYQSLSVKSSVGIFTHQGHISQVGSTVSLTDSLTHSLTHTITSRASCDAKNTSKAKQKRPFLDGTI